MAQCSNCGKSVGCSCSLIGGLCTVCYSEGIQNNTDIVKKTTSRKVFKQLPDAPPNTEFELILNTSGLTRDEKLRRINDILEKAMQ